VTARSARTEFVVTVVITDADWLGLYAENLSLFIIARAGWGVTRYERSKG